MEIITRQEAKAKGLNRYFTGKPCKRGHVVERNVYNHSCPECLKITKPIYYEKNKEKILAQTAQYYQNHKKEHHSWCRNWYLTHKEKVNDAATIWRKDHPEKARVAVKKWADKNRQRLSTYAKLPERVAWQRQYNKEHQLQGRIRSANRRAKMINATPPWADMDAIKFFYECCPKGCQVDHIIPLNGKNISGLHIAENLQWLTLAQNMTKSNKWPYYDSDY